MTDPAELLFTRDEVAANLGAALAEFISRDHHLLAVNAGEVAWNGPLSAHVREHFPGWIVSTEYDRNGYEAKALRDLCGDGDVAIRPDIIVHQYGPEGPNLLAVELKKASNTNRAHDICKLKAMTLPRKDGGLGYAWGALVVLGLHKPKPIRWFAGGEEVEQ
ncbi:MAG: hypothetical protein AB7J35_00035 [Dehalococcoidia bacterium]